MINRSILNCIHWLDFVQTECIMTSFLWTWWRGTFGTLMIMRSIFLWSDWWKFSILNRVMEESTNQNEASVFSRFVQGFLRCSAKFCSTCLCYSCSTTTFLNLHLRIPTTFMLPILVPLIFISLFLLLILIPHKRITSAILSQLDISWTG